MPESLDIRSIPSDLYGLGGTIRLRVRLLGAVDVILDGRRLRAFDSPRLQRLLALIALRREHQNRSQLAFTLWPESSEHQARTNLRKLLHEFRQALPETGVFAEIGPKTVRWLPSELNEVDVLSFREANASGDFEGASRIYKGDLLPSCYDDWVLAERAALSDAALTVHRQLASAAFERGDHLLAIRHAEAASNLEFTDETAIRIGLQAHRAIGDRTGAVRTFRRYADNLRRELAIDPAADLTALFKEICVDPSDPEHPPATRANVPGATRLVGRELEWRTLIEAFETVSAGRSHLVLLTGEPGIGKSRLAKEFSRHVRAKGGEVAAARAYEAAGRLPWGPVIDLLRSTSIERRLRELDKVWIAELARLLPELDGAVPQHPNGGRGGVARRHRLFDAICAAVAANERSRMLIIDDLQWCDTETIEFIGYLLRSNPQSPILIVGTVRWEELGDRHPLPGMVEALRRDQSVTVVTIDPLDKASTTVLAVELQGGDEIAPELAARLWNETEGNPLFIVETVRGGISADCKQGFLTPTMRSVLHTRLDQLTDDARKLAEAAAIYGRSFPIRTLEAVMGFDKSVTDQFDELWRRRILIDRGHGYDFSHDKLREVLIELINPARRRQLHRMIAEVLAREYREDSTRISAQLAAHYDQAGMTEQAIAAYRIAGARAVAMSGLDEAVALLSRALVLLAELPATAERDAVDLDIRIALGSPLVSVEGYGSSASHRLYERALSLCRQLGRPVAPPILRGLGLASLQGCRFDQSTDHAQALIDHVSGDHVAGTEGRYLMGVSAFWQGDLAKSLRFLEAAIEHYDPAQREEHLECYAQDPKAVCLVRLGLARLWSGDPARAASLAKAAAELAEDIDHLMTSAYVVTYSAILAAEAEGHSRCDKHLKDADRIWSRLSERYLKIVLDALRGWLEVRNGNTAGIEKIVDAAALSRIEGESLHLSYILLLLARARGLRGELHEAHAALREALAWSERCSQRYLVPELLRFQGEIAYGLGETEASQRLLCKAVEVAHAQRARWLKLKALYSLASRFPGAGLRAQLAKLAGDLPSGHELPAFRAAVSFLREAR